VRCAEPPEWIEIDGRGVIYAITTCHRAGEPWLEDRVPYSVALVDLSEGLRLLGRITGEPLDHHAIGVAVLAHVTRDPRTAPAIEFLLDELEVDR
jgi:uncharacterized OB-fold protein